MNKFFSIKNYNVNDKKMKDGFKDIKLSTSDLFSNIKNFGIVFLIFFVGSILKDMLFANTATKNFEVQKGTSLMIKGDMNFDTAFYIISFFIVLMIYFFTVDVFSDLENVYYKDSAWFSFTKLLDYKVYLIAFSIFLMLLICFKIATYPVFQALPDIKISEIVSFISLLSDASSGQDLETSANLINSDPIGQKILYGLSNIQPFELFLSFSIASLLLVFGVIFHFNMFINLVIYNEIGFFESLKIAIYFNINNGLYLTVVTLLIILLGFIVSIINSFVSIYYIQLALNSFITVYTLYIFTWVIVKNTSKK